MRVRLLSRSSDLAVLQAEVVAEALRTRWPSLSVETLTRSSLGDRDSRVTLWDSPDRGLFTTDLSEALMSGAADLAVHSWKDLPVTGFPGTTVAGTLERADPRDVLLVRRDVVTAQPSTLSVLTSSPRRAWQLRRSIPALLPWKIADIDALAVRGNIPTRLQKLMSGEGDALVVAKAALDRLLSGYAKPAARDAIRNALDGSRWMVLPIHEFPTAPAQGALAIEIASDRTDMHRLVEGVSHDATFRAVSMEREILAGYGGGCHEAIGATVLIRDYGVVTSVRGRLPTGAEFEQWSLDPSSPQPPHARESHIWPRPDERDEAVRRPLDVTVPVDARGWWIARADALPDDVSPGDGQIVWAAGTRTWRKLAARGVWVHGCSDALGDAESPGIDSLCGRDVTWRRLTHSTSSDPDAFATYAVRTMLPDDLGDRTHFFWTSGSLFREAVSRHPAILGAWHASGPGRTSRIIRETIDDAKHVSIWLDYDQWHHHVIR